MPEGLYRDWRALGSPYVDPSRPLGGGRTHCCAHMTAAVTYVCDQHESPYECPDNLVVYDHAYDEYGLVVHDGGPSSVQIRFCPWCGTALPASKRDAWFDGLKQLGIEPHSNDVPEDFRSDAWWQADEA
jgi:hypothetical protein